MLIKSPQALFALPLIYRYRRQCLGTAVQLCVAGFEAAANHSFISSFGSANRRA